MADFENPLSSAASRFGSVFLELFPFFKYVLVDPRNWSDVLMEFAETILKTKDSIYQPIDFIQKFVVFEPQVSTESQKICAVRFLK